MYAGTDLCDTGLISHTETFCMYIIVSSLLSFEGRKCKVSEKSISLIRLNCPSLVYITDFLSALS